RSEGNLRRVQRAAVAARINLLDRLGAGGDQRSELSGLLAAALGKIALGVAVAKFEIGRVASAWRIGVNQQHDLPALAKKRPASFGSLCRRDRRNQQANEENCCSTHSESRFLGHIGKGSRSERQASITNRRE